MIVPLVLAFGALYGAAMGALIHYFRLQPFIVTLAGMFRARRVLPDHHAVDHDQRAGVSCDRGLQRAGGGGTLSAGALIALATLAGAIYVAHFTRFGRNVYAIGGNERSALLMGLPVARTKVGVYALSGFCSALGGVVFTLYVLSGYGLQAQGWNSTRSPRP